MDKLKIEKVIRDGKVAVLYSPGYGAGWSSWAGPDPECQEAYLFDPDVVSWVENGKVGDCPDIAEKYGIYSFYNGGAANLTIAWIPVGTLFRIKEYDGYETVVRHNDDDGWKMA